MSLYRRLAALFCALLALLFSAFAQATPHYIGVGCIGGSNANSPCTVASQCPGGTCTATAGYEGECTGGPFEQWCGPDATFKGCTTDAECALYNRCEGGANDAALGCTVASQCPGGVCDVQICSVGKFRACYTDNGVVTAEMLAQGYTDAPVADTAHPALAALFCLGPTNASALDTVSGLPGPGRLQMPLLMQGLPQTPRLVDNGDGTVTDSVTGLQWEEKTTAVGSGVNLADPHDVDNRYTWGAVGSAGTAPNGTAFTDFLAALNTVPCFADHCDWRLPTVNHNGDAAELDAILQSPCGGSPCIESTFGATAADWYWSGTPYAADPQFAWLVYFDTGLLDGGFTVFDAYVRAVRGP